MIKKSFETFIVTIKIIFLLILVSSCNFGPQPDKVIQITLELDDRDVYDGSQIDSVINTLRKRLKKITLKPEVVGLPDQHRIKIKVATYYEVERFKNYILNPGKLDFYETYKNDEITPFLIKVNMLAKRKDTIVNPLFDLIKETGYSGGPILFSVEEKDTAEVKKYFSSKAAESVLPDKKRFIKFLWGVRDKGNGYFPLYALKKNRLGNPALSGDLVTNAFVDYSMLDKPVMSMRMNEEGAKKWADLTGKAFQQRSQIAIVLNNEVYSVPGVSSGPIQGGRSEISGDFTVEEAQDFANILMSGALPKMKLVSFEVEKIK